MNNREKVLLKFISKEMFEKLGTEESTESDINMASAEVHNKFLSKFKSDPDFTKELSDTGFSAGRAKSLNEMAKIVGLEDGAELSTIKERISFLTKQSDPESLKANLEGQLKARETQLKAEFETEKREFVSNLKRVTAIESSILMDLVNKDVVIPAGDILELAKSKILNNYKVEYDGSIKNLDGSQITSEDKLTVLSLSDIVSKVTSPYIKKADAAPTPPPAQPTPPTNEIEPVRVIVNKNDVGVGNPLHEATSYFDKYKK